MKVAHYMCPCGGLVLTSTFRGKGEFVHPAARRHVATGPVSCQTCGKEFAFLPPKGETWKAHWHEIGLRQELAEE